MWTPSRVLYIRRRWVTPTSREWCWSIEPYGSGLPGGAKVSDAVAAAERHLDCLEASTIHVERDVT